VAGPRVVVLEKSRFPRPKICGSFLSHEAVPVLERMGALEPVRAAGAETIGRFTLVRREGKSVEGDLPAPVLSLSRERLDTLVAAAAAQAGATQRFGTAVLSLEGDLRKGFRLRTSDLALRARVVLGRGALQPARRQLERPRYRQKATLIGSASSLRGAARGSLAVSSSISSKGDIWVCHGWRGVSSISPRFATPKVAQDGHHDLGELLSGLKRQSRSLAADLEGLSPVPGPVLLSEPVHLGLHGSLAGDVLLVGDAAGVIDPTPAPEWRSPSSPARPPPSRSSTSSQAVSTARV